MPEKWTLAERNTPRSFLEDPYRELQICSEKEKSKLLVGLEVQTDLTLSKM
jgi:hypothetical protein